MEPTKKLLPGQFTFSDALTKTIETRNESYNKTWDEIEEARKADWKRPEGSEWKFSWEPMDVPLMGPLKTG